ncbi:MAG: hypothetical protein EXR05_09895 [Acetobacteraceae bacterium]|nr:hypothetical protein [Acetobacteraceae bacterium]MSP30058.1 hypothetical protein [Acetobacteraceae bacterium]
MTDDPPRDPNGGNPTQGPESLLPYDDWTEEALRHVVVRAIGHAIAHGLPGGHHFYLTFRTDHPGTVIPPRLKQQYPEEMTIVLQNQFWDLRMDEAAGTIGVALSFGGVPATLVIPLVAVTGFADPHVRFGLRFRPVATDTPAPEASPEPTSEPDPAAEPPSTNPQVISLDAFRRRPSSKVPPQ